MHKFSHGTTGSPDTIRGMSVEMLFDFMSVRLDSAKAAGKKYQPELQYEQWR
ncbi:hypothetical protein KZ773_14465 [Escherichia coli]|nr:hypothetical protein [Escherichia coli]